MALDPGAGPRGLPSPYILPARSPCTTETYLAFPRDVHHTFLPVVDGPWMVTSSN